MTNNKLKRFNFTASNQNKNQVYNYYTYYNQTKK